ncbi:MAG: MFS transporter [Clostridiales bacterium]|nr:MFS transporter [Clostridiales bacterium]
MKKKIYLLLAVIFLIFIGLGSANALLGSSWPAISAEIGVNISLQGILTTIIYLMGTIGAANAKALIARFNTWLPISIGVAMVAVAVLWFSYLHGFVFMAVCGAILGFFNGIAVSSVNGYVAKHYTASAMNWLHCSYAAGCAIGPAIISYFILTQDSWRMGYRVDAGMVFVVFVILALSFRLWKAHEPGAPGRAAIAAEATEADTASKDVPATPPPKPLSNRELLRLPEGVAIPLIMFVFASFEVVIFFWTTSFLTVEKGMTPGAAAGMMAFFFGAQIASRFVCGFLAMKFSDRVVIRIAMPVALAGVVALIFAPDSLIVLCLVVIGAAAGPTFPLLIHEVPSIVGKENAQGIIGLQMAAANLGTALAPLLMGVIAGIAGFKVFPVYLIVLIALSIVLKIAQYRRMSDSGGLLQRP